MHSVFSKIVILKTHTSTYMHKHVYSIEEMRGSEWGLGGGCRLAVIVGEGGLWCVSHPNPLIPTVTEWSRWHPTKSSDTDGSSANDAPNLQSKTNRWEDGRTVWSLCPDEEVSKTSTVLVLVLMLGLHMFSYMLWCHIFNTWANTEWLDSSG